MKRRLQQAYGDDVVENASNPKVRKLVRPILQSEGRFRDKVLQSIMTDELDFNFTCDDMQSAQKYQTQKVLTLLELCNEGAPKEHDLVSEMGLLFLLIRVNNELPGRPRQNTTSPETIQFDIAKPQIYLWSRLHRMAVKHSNDMFEIANASGRYGGKTPNQMENDDNDDDDMQ